MSFVLIGVYSRVHSTPSKPIDFEFSKRFHAKVLGRLAFFFIVNTSCWAIYCSRAWSLLLIGQISPYSFALQVTGCFCACVLAILALTLRNMIILLRICRIAVDGVRHLGCFYILNVKLIIVIRKFLHPSWMLRYFQKSRFPGLTN